MDCYRLGSSQVLLEPQMQVGTSLGHPDLPLSGGLTIVPRFGSLGFYRFEQNLHQLMFESHSQSSLHLYERVYHTNGTTASQMKLHVLNTDQSLTAIGTDKRRLLVSGVGQ